jgi:hypothetical protein
LTVSGAFVGESYDGWHWRRALGGLISEFPEVRAYVKGPLKDGLTTKQLALLVSAVGEDPGTNGVPMLSDLEMKTGRSFMTWPSIQSVVTEHVPPVELRRKLLAMTGSGGKDDPAARCLKLIDKLRDEYGALESKPRHPDLASGKQWPILSPYPYAEDES